MSEPILFPDGSFEFTMKLDVVDPELFVWLGVDPGVPDSEPTYTLVHSVSNDPSDRVVTSLRGLLRQMLDIMVFEFRKATGEIQTHRAVTTLYNVRFDPRLDGARGGG